MHNKEILCPVGNPSSLECFGFYFYENDIIRDNEQ